MRPEFSDLHLKARKAFLTATAAILVTSVAQAQPAPPHQAYEGPPRPIELTQTPQTAYRRALSDADSAALRSALDAAGDLALDESDKRLLVDGPLAERSHQRRHDALEQRF